MRRVGEPLPLSRSLESGDFRVGPRGQDRSTPSGGVTSWAPGRVQLEKKRGPTAGLTPHIGCSHPQGVFRHATFPSTRGQSIAMVLISIELSHVALAGRPDRMERRVRGHQARAGCFAPLHSTQYLRYGCTWSSLQFSMSGVSTGDVVGTLSQGPHEAIKISAAHHSPYSVIVEC